MSFEKLLCATIALYVLLNFAFLPRLTKAWKASRRLGKISKAGLLSAVEFARDLALITSIMYLGFAVLILVLSFSYSGNARILAFIVAWAGQVHTTLKSTKDFVDSYFFLLPAALILYVFWLRQVTEFKGKFERLVNDEYDRLNREREQDAEWDALEPDETMKSLDQQIASIEESLGRLSPGEREKRQPLRRQIIQLREHRNEADYQRRIRIETINNSTQKDDGVPTWRRFLLSKGLFSDLKGATKLLSRITLAILSIALIGIASHAGLSTEIWNRVLNLDNLRVESNKAKVAKDWKEPDLSAKNEALSEEDRRAISILADTFARALVQNHNWRPLQTTLRSSAELRQEIARREILGQVRLPESNGNNTPAFTDDLPASNREILQEVSGEARHSSRLGEIIAKREGPSVKAFFGAKWEDVKSSILIHAKTYQEPVSLKDLESSLIDRIVSASFDSVVPNSDQSEIVKQARSAMSSATKKAVNEAVTTEFHRVMEDLASGHSYTERIAKVKTEDIPFPKSNSEEIAAMIHDQHLPDLSDFHQRMSSNAGGWRPPDTPAAGPSVNPGFPQPPHNGGGGSSGAGAYSHDGAGAGSASADPASNPLIRNVVQRATRNGQISLREDAVDALAQYEDHFPRSIASQARTPLAHTLETFRLPADAAEFGRLAEIRVVRASSFSMLRGFSRVGGVLIGAEPENPKDKVDIRSFSWQIAGRNVTLTLTDASGHVFEFGPYDIGLVHQSLAYVADGRPVAVTMTKARPLPQLKIHLNPSLVDTPLGCRVTHLDRLVDTYAGIQLPARTETTKHYAEQFAVYNLAWGGRLKALSRAAGRQEKELEEDANAALERNREEAQKGLAQPELFGHTSVFYRKPEYFDLGLVKIATKCRNADVEVFARCVNEEIESASALRERDITALRHWFEGHARFDPWSGVRERKFRITRDLAFLRQPAGGTVEDRVWPFDFIVQIAFTSPAVNLPEKDQEKFVDMSPIEFVDLQPEIEKLVSAGIDREGFRPAFEDLRSFTVLQRLFRAALRGNLGDNFPLEQLSRLTAATGGSIPYFHTLRWNGSYTAAIRMELLKIAQANPSAPWLRAAASQARQCSSALQQVMQSGRTLANACDFSAFHSKLPTVCPSDSETIVCRWKRTIEASSSLGQMVQLEQSFGVFQDEVAGPEQKECPPLAPGQQTAIARSKHE